jgi:hypothetical protein
VRAVRDGVLGALSIDDRERDAAASSVVANVRSGLMAV